LWQIEQRIDNPFELPATLIDADKSFILPEFAVSPEQRQLVERTIFPFPGREFYRLLLSPKYLFQFELPYQISRIKAIFEKIILKLGL
jgi:hypothetical protein